MSSPPPLPVPRSTFVTTLAWIFITLAGFTTLIAVLQNVMLQTVFQPMMHQAIAQQPMPAGTPPAMVWLTLHMAWFFRAFLLLAAAHLVAAIALLRRKEWGRKIFIGVMGFDILYQLAGLGMQWFFMRPMMRETAAMQPRHMSEAASAQMAQSMQIMDGMMSVLLVFATVMAIAFIALFCWIILRLRRPAIRREFSTAANSY